MKKLFLQAMLMSATALSAKAQFEIGTQVSYLKGHGRNDNHTTLVGTTVYGSYALSNRIAVGSAMHLYKPKKTRYTEGGISYSATDQVSNVSGTFDVMLGAKGSPVQPYAGIDIGISSSAHKVEYVNDKKQTQVFKINRKYTMFSPKAGINIAVSNIFGVFSQVQYNYCPGDGNPAKLKFTNAKYVYVLSTEPISKYINVDAGVYLMLGNIRKLM